ncbi:disease resistance protein RPS5-like [Punica granatum]|uniref:Disease resistance protein RPS5-like n=1 Tax=Punica granatum TaxID=22663 RepID=A0A6P8BQS2_PUNGR|nr:disease resistance protein RPS5-like [Punica granatum]
MVEIPLEPPVGIDSSFEEAWKWVQDEKVRRIGIYGMGGVGKTTLLKKIHNEFLGIQHDYNVVASIVVSRPTNPKKIQEAIWEKLNLPKLEWDRTSELDRAPKIFRKMKERSFLLFLDDVWEEIDLLNLGIPSRGHPHKSKIIFTTRSMEVCGVMQADRTKKVECLPPDKALELIQEKVGEETWSAHVEIPRLAILLVKECEYLPLAIVTVGAAMASRKHPDEWRCAVEDLKNRPSSFAGMEKRVLAVLEFSYDALPNETQKKCFLYCSVFPEDYKLEVDRLIDLWIGEGFLDECDCIYEARRYGLHMISNLTRVCLLEEYNSSDNPSLRSAKLHDVVRDMALWVATEHGQKKNRRICQEKQRSFELKEMKKWNDAEKIYVSLVDPNIENLPATLTTCPNLSTLILTYTMLETFPNGFFSSMPLLRVLILSYNKYLRKLPEDIGVLVNLRQLDLRSTKVRELPEELKNLIKLVFLLLDHYCHVPEKLISSLPSLRVFSWGRPLSIVDLKVDEKEDELDVIKELNGMNNRIEDFSLALSFATSVQKLLEHCPYLLSCLSRLELVVCLALSSLEIPKASMRRMEHLEVLTIESCAFDNIRMGERSDGSGYPRLPSYYPELTPTSSHPESQVCFRSLKRIIVKYCRYLREVTVLIYHAPSLTHLEIRKCSSMQEVITRDVEDSRADEILSFLIEFHLEDLPELKSICSRALPFPSLELLEVERCPKLKKLPLDSSSSASARQLSRIEGGSAQWWDGLQWDDPETKQYFSTKFVNYSSFF